jgi:hypothetical protein
VRFVVVDIGVKQQRDHHRRIVRRPPVPIGPIAGVERRQIKLRHSIDHEPREVVFGQPLTQARRQQQLLVAITCDEVLRHPGMVLTVADRPGARLPPCADCDGRAAAEGPRPQADNTDDSR